MMKAIYAPACEMEGDEWTAYQDAYYEQGNVLNVLEAERMNFIDVGESRPAAPERL
jgi:hypothetical protein